MFKVEMDLCLRQGYNCACGQCQVWIKRWKMEFDVFRLIDNMIENKNNLFQIYERLRAEHPVLLAQHHRSIEQQCVERRYAIREEGGIADKELET